MSPQRLPQLSVVGGEGGSKTQRNNITIMFFSLQVSDVAIIGSVLRSGMATHGCELKHVKQACWSVSMPIISALATRSSVAPVSINVLSTKVSTPRQQSDVAALAKEHSATDSGTLRDSQ